MKDFVIIILSILAAVVAMLGFIIVTGQMFGEGGVAIRKGLAIVMGLAVFAGIREVLRHKL